MGDVDEAKAAWRAEEDPVNKEGLWQMWKEAKDELHSFRRQQVAGGEDPKQGCRGLSCMPCGSRGCAWREALSRVLPPGLAGAPELRHAGHIRTCSVHPTRAAPSGCRVTGLFIKPVSQW